MAVKIPTLRIGSFDVTAIAKETAREAADNDLPGLAAEMAYHSILALFPFLLFLAGVTAIADNAFRVDNMSSRIIEQASKVLPSDATSVLGSFVEEVVDSDGSGAIGFGLIGTLWAGSGAIGSTMKGLNRIYDRAESRGFIRRRLMAIGLTFVFSGSLLIAAIAMSTGRLLASWAGDALGWEEGVVNITRLALWPLSLGLIVFAATVLYWLGSPRQQPFHWAIPGALLFAAGWIAASLAFSVYVSNFGSYNRTYGSLTAVIILLVWLYWSSLLLLVGGQLNAVLEKQIRQGPRKPRTRTQGARPQP